MANNNKMLFAIRQTTRAATAADAAAQAAFESVSIAGISQAPYLYIMGLSVNVNKSSGPPFYQISYTNVSWNLPVDGVNTTQPGANAVLFVGNVLTMSFIEPLRVKNTPTLNLSINMFNTITTVAYATIAAGDALQFYVSLQYYIDDQNSAGLASATAKPAMPKGNFRFNH